MRIMRVRGGVRKKTPDRAVARTGPRDALEYSMTRKKRSRGQSGIKNT